MFIVLIMQLFMALIMQIFLKYDQENNTKLDVPLFHVNFLRKSARFTLFAALKKLNLGV